MSLDLIFERRHHLLRKYLQLFQDGRLGGADHGPHVDRFQATQEALEHIGQQSISPQTPEENIAMWREKLNGGARRMFDTLVSIYPESMTREEMAEQAGLIPTTGTFGTYLSQLRSNELIEMRDGKVKASDNLFV